MTARERLIGMEQYNSRSFHLITEEAIEAVEAAAIATERARLRAAVDGLDGYPVFMENDDDTLVERRAVLALLDEVTR